MRLAPRSSTGPDRDRELNDSDGPLRAAADAISEAAREYRQAPYPERIHKIRVTTRRARAFLDSLITSEQDAEQVQELRNALRRLARSISPTRDHDVIDLLVQDSLKKADDEESDALEPLAVAMEERSASLYSNAVGQLKSPNFYMLLKQLRLFEPGDSAGQPATHGPAAEIATRSQHLRRAYRRWRRDDTPANLHRMRVATKKLRYALIARPGNRGEKSSKAIARRLADLQDLLGDINDLYIASEYLAATRRENEGSWTAETMLASQQLIDRFEKRAERLIENVRRFYRRAHGKKRRRASLKELM